MKKHQKNYVLIVIIAMLSIFLAIFAISFIFIFLGRDIPISLEK